MLTKERALKIMEEAGVLQEGHFELTSGRHSARYLQCARIFQDARYAEELCAGLAEKLGDLEIGLVVGPAVGAVQMAYEVSRQLGVKNIFTERENGKMTLRRGFSISPGERVLIVEDVITTGGSVREVIDVVKKSGGVLAAVSCIVDRTGGKIDFETRFEALVSLETISYAPEECPLCEKGLPITKPGSRTVAR